MSSIDLEQVEKDRECYLSKDEPFIVRGHQALKQQYVCKQFEREFNQFCQDDAHNPHLYENMETGSQILADLSCTGCPSFAAHLQGHCLPNLNVICFESPAIYHKNKLLHEYRNFMIACEEQYITEADQIHAEALKLAPELTPELIATLATAENVEEKYQKPLELILLAERIPLVAAERKEVFLEQKQASLTESVTIAALRVRVKNRVFIDNMFLEGKIDESIVSRLG